MSLHGFLQLLIAINYAKPTYIPQSLTGVLLAGLLKALEACSIEVQVVQWKEHIWLPLVGPKLELGTKIMEAVSY